MRRREFIGVLAGAAATWPLAARAQQSTFQVGFLYPGPQAAASPRIAAYSSGLQAGGIRPQQVDIIARMTDGDAAPLAPMAADLVARKVDVIAAISPAAVRAAHGAPGLEHVQVPAHRRDGRVHQLAQLLERGELHPDQMLLDPFLPFFGLHYLPQD